MAKKSILIRAVALLILISVALGSATSCDFFENTVTPPNTSDNTVNNDTDLPIEGDVPLGTEGLIYNSKTNLKLILIDYDYYEVLGASLAEALSDTFDIERFKIRYFDDKLPFDHEIVIGPSERRVSREAYTLLDGLMAERESSFGGYVLYSDGSSLALAYTKEMGIGHLKEIMADLTEKAKKVSLVAKAGVVSSKIYNMYEFYGAEDKALRDEAFLKLAESTSPEIASAVRDFYSELYKREDGRDIIAWLAALYQPRSCICENYDSDGTRICLHPVGADGRDLCFGGGFYYSNGARDTDGYLPDIESTNQALELLEKTGMLDSFGGQYQNFISGQLRADIVAFTKGLQSSDGYFYHPQWTVEESQAHWARVSRDLMWSVSILSSFGEKPYYKTPTGEFAGTGGRPSAASALTARLNEGQAASVSRLVYLNSSLPAHLQSARAFREYLSGKRLDVWGNGYGVANELAAQVGQIVEANKQIGGDQIKTILFEWIEKDHREDNGLWTPTCYDALNAAFKIMMVYSAFKMPFRYAEAALNSAIEVLSSSEDPVHVCGTYNAWYDIAGLIRNIRTFKSEADADRLQARVIEIAPDAIKQTIVNTSRFLCDDGSFSYFADRTSVTSQGMPVSPAGKMGDVNASIICSGGIVEYIGMALGTKLPPIFGNMELAEFMDMIGN